MEALRRVDPEEFEAIPGLRLLTPVGELRSEQVEFGSNHRVRAVVHVSPDGTRAETVDFPLVERT
jgi:hypothetical protein